MISALAFLGVCTIMVYSACDRDSCLTLKCKHEAPCVNGVCKCPTGYVGTECQTWATDRWVNSYLGDTKCNSTPPFFDSLSVAVASEPDKINVYIKSKPGYVFYGMIDGDQADLVDTAHKATGHIVLDKDTKITLYMEETLNSEKSTCSFVGNDK